MHTALCICDELTLRPTRTRVALVMHHREVKKSTNTGRLALLMLENSVCFVRGRAEEPADLSELGDPSRRNFVLFPREDAVELTPGLVASDPRPVTLIVPDGTWGQARRAVRREPALRAATAVLPPDDGPTRYRLRDEPIEGGLGTAEAIARALGVLEGAEVRRELERVFDLMVERTLDTRQRPG